MTKEFIIHIEETVVEKFKVLASNEEEAYKIAKEKYYSGKFVIEDGEVHYKQMSISDSKNNISEWIEF